MKFTIITSAYRGDKFLHRAYQSLLGLQGGHQFEWIIVDDFSNDSGKTGMVMEDIKAKAAFPVSLIFLEKNYYGSRSTYEAASIACGEYGVILDQDDMLKPDALEIFIKYIDIYESHADFAGVCGRCENLRGEFIGTPLENDAYYSNELVVRRIDRVLGEMFQCTKVILLLEYFRDMKPGYTNGWAWIKMAKKYSFLYVNSVVRIYDTENSYSHTNTISATRKIKYLRSRFEQVFDEILDSIEYLKRDKTRLVSLSSDLIRYGLHLQVSPSDIAMKLPLYVMPFLMLTFPISLLKYLNDIRENRVTLDG